MLNDSPVCSDCPALVFLRREFLGDLKLTDRSGSPQGGGGLWLSPCLRRVICSSHLCSPPSVTSAHGKMKLEGLPWSPSTRTPGFASSVSAGTFLTFKHQISLQKKVLHINREWSCKELEMINNKQAMRSHEHSLHCGGKGKGAGPGSSLQIGGVVLEIGHTRCRVVMLLCMSLGVSGIFLFQEQTSKRPYTSVLMITLKDNNVYASVGLVILRVCYFASGPLAHAVQAGLCATMKSRTTWNF